MCLFFFAEIYSLSLKGRKVEHHGHHSLQYCSWVHTQNYKDECDKDVMTHGTDTPANRLTEACSLVPYIEHQGQGCCLTGTGSPEAPML